MARFEVEVNGQRYEVEAPDQQSAVNALSQLNQQPQAPNPNASSLPGPLGDFQNFSRAFQSGATQGMTLGFGDELQAGLLALPEAIGASIQGQPFDVGQGFNTALERVRGADVASRELNPIANVAGNITGNMALGGALSKGGISFMSGAKPTIGSMAGRGALEGLTYGAITGLGTGESLEDRVTQAATGGAVGGVLGGLTGAVGGALANRGVSAATPESSTIADDAGALYDAAKNSGVVFPQQSAKQVANDISAVAISEGLDPDLHPMATAALKRLQAATDGNMTAQDAHTIRRVLGAAQGDLNNPDQTRIARLMTRAFDDYIGQSVPEFGAANALYQTAKKTELIENTIQKARDMSAANYTASGFEQALRAQFKNLLTSPSALRGFSEQEVAAIRQVAEGGPIENAFRYLGRLAPTGIISTGIGGGAGYALGGPLGAAAVLGSGAAAKNAATASTLNNANLARALIAGGGQLPALPNAALVNALNTGTAAAGGVGGGEANKLLLRALAGR